MCEREERLTTDQSASQEEIVTKYKKELSLKHACEGWPYKNLFPDEESHLTKQQRLSKEATSQYYVPDL